jgi:hypothetical protein
MGLAFALGRGMAAGGSGVWSGVDAGLLLLKLARVPCWLYFLAHIKPTNVSSATRHRPGPTQRQRITAEASIEPR